jgi:hypothetical protein
MALLVLRVASNFSGGAVEAIGSCLAVVVIPKLLAIFATRHFRGTP